MFRAPGLMVRIARLTLVSSGTSTESTRCRGSRQRRLGAGGCRRTLRADALTSPRRSQSPTQAFEKGEGISLLFGPHSLFNGSWSLFSFDCETIEKPYKYRVFWPSADFSRA